MFNSCGVDWNNKLDNLVNLVFVARSFILSLTILIIFNIVGMTTIGYTYSGF